MLPFSHSKEYQRSSIIFFFSCYLFLSLKNSNNKTFHFWRRLFQNQPQAWIFLKISEIYTVWLKVASDSTFWASFFELTRAFWGLLITPGSQTNFPPLSWKLLCFWLLSHSAFNYFQFQHTKPSLTATFLQVCFILWLWCCPVYCDLQVSSSIVTGEKVC